MEKIIVHCPKCFVKIRVSNKVLGTNRPCPKCKKLFLVQADKPEKPIVKVPNQDNEFSVEFTSDPIKKESNSPEVVVNQADRSKTNKPGLLKKIVDVLIVTSCFIFVGLEFICKSLQNKKVTQYVFPSVLALIVYFSLNDDGNSKKTINDTTPKIAVKKKVVKKAKPAIYIPRPKKSVSKSTGFSVGGNKKSYRKKQVKKEIVLTKEEQYQLGRKYNKGIGVAKNYVKAAYWYEKAANVGHQKAQHSIGYLYEEGLGVSKNQRLAIYWYEKAAGQGYLDSQFNLALIYKQNKQYTKAVYWYKKAARQGDAEAQNSLGAIYYNGNLGYENVPLAYQWFTLAAKKGNKDAINNLRIMRKNMANSMINSAFSGFLNSNSGGSSSGGFDVRNQDDAAWLSRNYQRMHGTKK